MSELYIASGWHKRQVSLPDRGKDQLKTDALNALPGPLLARFIGGDVWPVYDIESECAILRIDVCGLLEVKPFICVTTLTDINGVEYVADDFWHD